MKKVSLGRALLAGALLVLCVWFIWSNSLLDAQASSLRSEAVARFVAQALSRVFGQASPVVRFIVYNIRKVAHAVEFFALGCVCSLMLIILRRVSVHMVLHGVLFTLFVAVADESIQIFTGRGAAVQDILLDFSAGMVGLLFLLSLWGLVLGLVRFISGGTS